jgi:tetratricopeptide (TPR) repeat protein
LLLAFAVWLAAIPTAPAQPTCQPPRELTAALRSRVAARPDDAASWRLLGRALWQQGDLAGGHRSLAEAVRLDPENAAAQCDLGHFLLSVNQPHEAELHLREAARLAPESSYGQHAHTALLRLGVPEEEIVPVDFQVDWLDAPTADPPPADITPQRLYFRLETGLLYNSNVELAPISRELSASEQASWQYYVAPDLEYRFLTGDRWQSGGLLRSYFNFNEDRFRDFDVQHLEPGLFVERFLFWEHAETVPRLEYAYSYDAFDGRTLGTRHGLRASATTYAHSGRTWLAYWMTDHTDFRDDGDDPDVTSLDGWSHTAGASLQTTGWGPIALARLGADGQWADLRGSTFRYRGVMLYGETESPFVLASILVLQFGWGYRDYPDFEFEPERNEHIWRGGVEVRKALDEHWWLAGTLRYDRFASKNDEFDADRYTTGALLTFER